MEPETNLVEEQDDAVIGRAFRWSIAVILGVSAIAAGIAIAWNWKSKEVDVSQTALDSVQIRDSTQREIPVAIFSDITDSAGIHFVHQNGAAGDKLLPETMGGGGGFWDYDNDGDQDILLVNSTFWPNDPRAATDRPTLQLFQNDGTGKFENVTAGSGLDISIYGMGLAFGDLDRDGFVDVFVSAVGSNKLFRNLGNGKFDDVTEHSHVAGADDQWSSSCGWFDYDRDGDLDLFVCNYVKWSSEFDLAQNFQLTGGGRAYGRPQAFAGTFCYLYRNDGDRFADVSSSSGIQITNPATGVPMGKSLAVTFADFDNDGWQDILVANDTVQNFLFHNQQDGTFQEIGAISGIAFDTAGKARGAMSSDVARFRNNETLGVAIGNFSNEMTALYVAYKNNMQFADEAVATGLGPNTRLELTFGLFFFDYDLDGRLDMLAANGHLEEEINRVQPSQHYEQPPQLFWNCGADQMTEFMPVSAVKCGSDFLKPIVGRGATYGDIDNDGDLDVLIIACGKAARLLRNDQNLGHNWIRFQLKGTTVNPDAIGAWVQVTTEHQTLYQQVMPTRSYQSQVELPVTFGLGKDANVKSIHVTWPDGTKQEIPDWNVNQTNFIHQSRAGSHRPVVVAR